MKAYQHILVASNLTGESKKVADKAASIAQKSAAKLSIVHIVEFSPLMYGGGEFAIPLDGDVEESIQKHAKEGLRAEGVRLNIDVADQWLESGVTAESLIQLVDDANVDLIVLGNHEQHGLSFLLGSTTNALLHAMPCDVLAVHV